LREENKQRGNRKLLTKIVTGVALFKFQLNFSRIFQLMLFKPYQPENDFSRNGKNIWPVHNLTGGHYSDIIISGSTGTVKFFQLDD